MLGIESEIDRQILQELSELFAKMARNRREIPDEIREVLELRRWELYE